MAGAAAQEYPPEVRRVIVQAVLDGHHGRRLTAPQALAHARGGQLDRLPALEDRAPSIATVREWVQKEKRHRASPAAGDSIWEVAERGKRMTVEMCVEKIEQMRRQSRSRSPKVETDKLDALNNSINVALKGWAGAPSKPNGDTDQDAEQTTPAPVSPLAERIAGRSRPTRDDNTPRNTENTDAGAAHDDQAQEPTNARSLVGVGVGVGA